MNKSDRKFISSWAKKFKAVALAGGKCQNCGLSDVRVMEFHHGEECDNKGTEVGTLIRRDNRWTLIEKEVVKCRLLCCNCHRESDTCINSRLSLLKRKLLEYKGVFCCEECGYTGANLNSLSFHHAKGEKLFKIMREIGTKNGTSEYVLPYIKKEVDKCEVLCANCHAKRHIDIDRLSKMWDDIANFSIRYKEKNKISRDSVFAMHKQGYKNIEIAKALNCAKSSVSYILGSK